MIIKILGILDIIAAVLFYFSATFEIIPSTLALLAAFYIIAKATAFIVTSKDPASFIDIIAGLIIFSSLNFTLPTIVIVLTTIYLLQKGVFSLF